MNPQSPNDSYVTPNESPSTIIDTPDYVTPSADEAVQKLPLTTRVNDIETLTRTVLVVVCATLVATLVALGAIVIDQFHFNYNVQQETSNHLNEQIEELEGKLETATQELNSANDTLLQNAQKNSTQSPVKQ